MKGESVLQIGGDKYRLKCTIWAMSLMEKQSGESGFDMIDRFQEGKYQITDLVVMVWAALQEHHEGTTMRQASDLLERDFKAVLEALGAAIVEAMDQMFGTVAGQKKSQQQPENLPPSTGGNGSEPQPDSGSGPQSSGG